MGFLAAFFKNFQLTNSIAAGGGASVLIYAAGAALVAANVVVPGLGIPLTMGMVGAVALVGGHVVTALMPDSVKQQVDALGKKIGVQVSDLKTMVPQIEASYPPQSSPPTTLTPSNINKNPS
jgi:hypothetical protein